VAEVPAETVGAVRDSLASALHTGFLLGLPLMALGLVAALMLKELPLRTKSHVEEATERRAAPSHGAATQEEP
jgi:hypothetical protein